jgi:hypothetical protein
MSLRKRLHGRLRERGHSRNWIAQYMPRDTGQHPKPEPKSGKTRSKLSPLARNVAIAPRGARTFSKGL